MRGRGYTPRGERQHTTSTDRRFRRAVISKMGRRRYLKIFKAYRRFQKEVPCVHY